MNESVDTPGNSKLHISHSRCLFRLVAMIRKSYAVEDMRGGSPLMQCELALIWDSKENVG